MSSTYIIQLSLVVGLQHQSKLNMREMCPLVKQDTQIINTHKRKYIIYFWSWAKVIWSALQWCSCPLTFLAAVLKASLWLISGLLALILWISSLQKKYFFLRIDQILFLINIIHKIRTFKKVCHHGKDKENSRVTEQYSTLWTDYMQKVLAASSRELKMENNSTWIFVQHD